MEITPLELEMIALTAGSFSGVPWDVRTTPMIATASTTMEISITAPIVSDAPRSVIEWFFIRCITLPHSQKFIGIMN
jgi:hypothetical protein